MQPRHRRWTAPGSRTSDGPTCGRRTTRTWSTPRSRCWTATRSSTRSRATSGCAASASPAASSCSTAARTLLRMVLAQNYWPESHLAAPDGAALRREVELVKELGFNGVRIHQKVEDPRFLVLVRPARRAGLGRDAQRLEFDTAHGPAAHPRVARGARARRIHPGLVAWVPFNESWGVPNLESDPAQRDAVRRCTTSPRRSTRPGRGRQRRLGAPRHRHPRRPRLQPRRPTCCASATAARGRRAHAARGPAVLPLDRRCPRLADGRRSR